MKNVLRRSTSLLLTVLLIAGMLTGAVSAAGYIETNRDVNLTIRYVDKDETTSAETPICLSISVSSAIRQAKMRCSHSR